MTHTTVPSPVLFADGRAVPLIGRDRELAAIRRVFAPGPAAGSGSGSGPASDAATGPASGGALFVVGEPGIGKTRLVAEAAAEARAQGVRVLRGRASRAGSGSLRPFVEALLGLAREGWTPPETLGPYRAILGRLVPDWNAEGTLTTPVPPFVYGEAILRVLKAARTSGVLLVLEDLHDADPDTVAVLEYLVDNIATIADQQAGVVCTVRDSPSPALDVAQYAQRADPRALLPLSRLGAKDIDTLCAALLGIPADLLPAELGESLMRDSAGHPLIADELLREQVNRGGLIQRGDRWELVEPHTVRAPRSLARDVADHVRASEPGTRRLLQSAAVLGDEFPADLLGSAARLDAGQLPAALDAATRDQYLVPGDRPGWLTFRHPMIAQAVRDQLAAPVRQELAAAAAEAIEQHAAEPGQDWMARAAVLRESAGDLDAACDLFAEAGAQALRDGSPALAAELFTHARRCGVSKAVDARWADLLGRLVTALGANGRHREALAFAAELDDVVAASQTAGTIDPSGDPASQSPVTEAFPDDPVSQSAVIAAGGILPPESVADLHIGFARVAARANWPDRVLVHVRAARAALGPAADEVRQAELDLLQADALLESPGRAAEADALAVRAAERAGSAGLPAIQAEALLLIGRCRRLTSPEESVDCYRRADRIARAHDLPGPRLQALLVIGTYEWMSHADPAVLTAAGVEARAQGAVIETRHVELSLAVDALFRGRFAEAGELLDTAWEDLAALRLTGLGSYALAARALLHAYRGHAADLAEALAAFDRWRGDRQDEVPLAHNLAQGFNALLHGDIDAARDHFRTLPDPCDSAAPKYALCGQYGLRVLLEVAYGTAGWEEYEAVWALPASRLPWNAQFLWLARALLTGRAGDRAGAEGALAEAAGISAAFPPAHHLGLCLVAPGAARDGWGDPARWLRDAETHYDGHEAPSAARTCRDMLRDLGEPVRQRRAGSQDVPERLWSLGITVREYEVMLEVAKHRTNREIAAQLHLSHRTVERHIANLLMKTDARNRRDLGELTSAEGGGSS